MRRPPSRMERDMMIAGRGDLIPARSPWHRKNPIRVEKVGHDATWTERNAGWIFLVAILLGLILGLVVPARGQGQDIVSNISGSWYDAGIWSCLCIPSKEDAVRVKAGTVVELPSNPTPGLGGAHARSLLVEGTLRASRLQSSTMNVYGNLIVTGLMDYGTPLDRIPLTVIARVRFWIDESAMVGGALMEPLDSDQGLYVVGQGKLVTDGPDRGAWAPMMASSPAGANQIQVDIRYSKGWKVGDEVMIGPSNTVATSLDARQDELRKITSAPGSGGYLLDAPLSFAHEVRSVPWIDQRGVTRVETLAPAVANMTKNIRFESGDGVNHPHAAFLDQARVELRDASFDGFGPAAKDIGRFPPAPGRPVGDLKPFGRYALHFHLMKEGAAGSVVDAVVVRRSATRALVVHDSYKVQVYDAVLHDVAPGTPPNGESELEALYSETVLDGAGVPIPETGAHDLVADRVLIVRFGSNDAVSRAAGIHFGVGERSQVFGSVAAGGAGPRNAGMFWHEPTHCVKGDKVCFDSPDRNMRSFRNTAHSSLFGHAWWTNSKAIDVVVDLLAWGNLEGIDFGAYTTRTTLHQVRLLGNADAQLQYRVTEFQLTDFLLDGLGFGGFSLKVADHNFDSAGGTVPEVLRHGVIRGSELAIGYQDEGAGKRSITSLSRVRFDEGTLDVSVMATANSELRILDQFSLPDPTSFTMWRADSGQLGLAKYGGVQVIGGVSLPIAPEAWLVTAPGCAADEQQVATVVTLCAESDQTQVTFYNGREVIGVAPVVGGVARLAINLSTWTRKRMYFYAGAEANGLRAFSQVWRLRKI